MPDELVTFETVRDSALKARIDIKTTPDKVYAAWTQPELLPKWFGPRSGGSLRIDRFDCSVGGGYDVTMIFADGDRVQIFGTYLELDPPKKIVLTWQSNDNPAVASETLVTVDLVPSETGTHLTLTHERFISAEVRSRHEEGWGPLLLRLASLLTD